MGQPISPTLSSQFLIFNILPRILSQSSFIGGEKYSTRVLEGRRFGQIESPIIFQPLRPDDKNLERIPWISLEDLQLGGSPWRIPAKREMPMLCIGRLFGLASQRNEGSVHPFTLHNALPCRAGCWHTMAYLEGSAVQPFSSRGSLASQGGPAPTTNSTAFKTASVGEMKASVCICISIPGNQFRVFHNRRGLF